MNCLGTYKADPHVYNVSQDLKALTSPTPQELLLIEPTGNQQLVTAATSYPNSRLLLTRRGSTWGLKDPDDNSFLSVEVRLPPKPAFWRLCLSDGMQYVRIVSTCGLFQANLWLWHDCAYPSTARQCRFCGVQKVESQRGASGLLSMTDILRHIENPGWWKERRPRAAETIITVLDEALRTHYSDHVHLVLITGNMPNGNEDLLWRISNDLVGDLASRWSLASLDSIAVLMPPNDIGLLEEARRRGLPAVSFNLELWDPQLFSTVCPGKAAFGRSRILASLERAVRIFGEGHVFTNLIVGIEPFITTIQGIKSLAAMGVVANPVVFHRDWGAAMWHHQLEDSSQLLDVFRDAGYLYRERHLRPPYCISCARTTLIHEAIQGWLD